MKGLFALLGLFLVMGGARAGELSLESETANSSYLGYAMDSAKAVGSFALEHPTATLGLTLASLATVAEAGPGFCAACLVGCCAAMGPVSGPMCIPICTTGVCAPICLAPTP